MKAFLHWTPRVLMIVFALFLSVFALDVFGEGHGFWRTARDLLLHLIPSILVLLVLAVAWRREWFGALMLIGLAMLYIATAWGRFPLSVYLTVAGPPALAGLLFLIDWRVRRQDGADVGV